MLHAAEYLQTSVLIMISR